DGLPREAHPRRGARHAHRKTAAATMARGTEAPRQGASRRGAGTAAEKVPGVHVASHRGLAPDRERPSFQRPTSPRTGQREAESGEATDGAINESLAPRPLAGRRTRLTDRPAPGRRAAPEAP